MMILEMIKHTPAWVWVIFVYLVYVGVQSTQKRRVYIPLLFVMPIVFTIFRMLAKQTIYISLGSDFAFWFIGLIVGIVRAQYIPIKIMKSEFAIEFPGNYENVIVSLSFFVMKYTFGFLSSQYPDIAAQYMMYNVIGTTLFTGYVYGKLAWFLHKYRSEK